MKNILNEELIKQIRLMNFDRSKTLLEQDPELEKGIGSRLGDNEIGDVVDCKNSEDFTKSYPYCCRYKELAKSTNFSDENDFPFKNGVGWCYYRDARQLDMYIPMDAELTFSNESFFDSFTKKLTEYLNEDSRLFYQTLWNSVTFKRLNQSMESTYPDFNVRKNIALTGYVRQRIEQLFPKGSIIRFNVNEGSYIFNSSVSVDPITSDLMFDWYYDQDGNQYDQPKTVDRRTDYQKFIDDWGMWVQLGALLAASIFVPAFAPVWGLYLELGLELSTGLILAQRDFEKGDNIMGVVNILTGGISSLKLIPAFRNINPAVAKRLSDYIESSKLNTKLISSKGVATLPPRDKAMYVNFIKNLAKKDPEAAQVLNKLTHYDPYTESLIKNELPKSIQKEVLDNIKNTIKNKPSLLGDIKIWDRLWVLDLKRQFGFMGLGLALDYSPLGKILNNEEKQKYKWIYENIPDYAKKIYDFNAANNPEIQKEILNDFTFELQEKCKNIKPEDLEQGILAIQEIKIKEKGDNYKPIKKDQLKSNDNLSKEGYVMITSLEDLDLPDVIDYKMSSEGNCWIRKKSVESNNNDDDDDVNPDINK